MKELRNEIIDLICNFPRWLIDDNKQVKDIFLKIIKWLKNVDIIIRIDELMTFLSKNIELVKEFNCYSTNKKEDGYFFRIENNISVFGFYDKYKRNTYQNVIMISENHLLTCSLFIIYELNLKKYFYL